MRQSIDRAGPRCRRGDASAAFARPTRRVDLGERLRRRPLYGPRNVADDAGNLAVAVLSSVGKHK
jgi:hypothetical protein